MISVLHGWGATEEQGAPTPTSGIALVEFQATEALLSSSSCLCISLVQPPLGPSEGLALLLSFPEGTPGVTLSWPISPAVTEDEECGAQNLTVTAGKCHVEWD